LPAPTRRSTVSAMARPRGPNEPSTYRGRPEIPSELTRRFDLIRAVFGEQTTIAEAARELSMARVNMQTLVHRAEAAILESLQPRSTGPTPRSAQERQLASEVRRLQKENDKLKKQLQAADEMMAAAGEIIRALRGLAPATSRTSSRRSKRAPKSTPDEDPEPVRTAQSVLRTALEHLRTNRDATRVARLLGIDTKTLRRWLERLSAGEPLFRRRGGTTRVGPVDAEQRVRDLVVDLHGLPGAESLARSVTGVSRRRAGMLKREVLSALERRRKGACSNVAVPTPGVMRGMDAMYLPSGFALIAADASVPYRTTVKHACAYNAEAVAGMLDEDFRTHGAPLVLRADRASCHGAEPVASVLRDHRVLMLHGPAYYAPYYGQHERQNSEHRAWCEWLDSVTQADLDRMKTAFNDAWLRPTLGWRSAAQCWDARRPLDDDRDELHEEVHRRAAQLRAHDVDTDLAMRLAIEQALTQRGYLKITSGRRLLCEH